MVNIANNKYNASQVAAFITGGTDTWRWNFNNSVSGANDSSNLQNPTHLYTATGPASVQIIVENCTIFIPNSFTPNGDGENDVFIIRGDGIDHFVIKIYDRWGKRIFESLDKTIGWNGLVNGKTNGKFANEGVYVYVITGNFISGDEINLKGNITLLH